MMTTSERRVMDMMVDSLKTVVKHHDGPASDGKGISATDQQRPVTFSSFFPPPIFLFLRIYEAHTTYSTYPHCPVPSFVRRCSIY